MTEENATTEAPSEEPNLLGAEEATTPQPEAVVAPETAATPEYKEQFPEPTLENPQVTNKEPQRPEWLPEKFKDPEALATSYKELEKAFHNKRDIPETYELNYDDAPVQLDEVDQKFFKELGFSQKQAQGVYSALMDTLVPQLREANTENELARLSASWNMDTSSMQFNERVGKISSWAEANLPKEVVATLQTNAKGVQSMFQMMQSQAGAGSQPAQSGTSQLSAMQLTDMVKDPRYATDEGFQQQVEAEFRRFYDNN